MSTGMGVDRVWAVNHRRDKTASGRFEESDPVVWIEHDPPDWLLRRRDVDRFDRVTFADWTPRPAPAGEVWRTMLGQPSWQPLSDADVAALVGAV